MASEATKRKTRLAPSPTGALHLGNVRTFLVNWALARQGGWDIVLRVEDLDTPRTKPGAIDESIEILEWLGMDWDEGPTIQTDDLSPHRRAVEQLARAGLVYPCELTRTQIAEAATAPHGLENTPDMSNPSRFPIELRPDERPTVFTDVEANWRFVTPAGDVEFEDAFAGAQRFDVLENIGDIVVWTKQGHPSYQLAVVVDDHRQGVTDVVRGDDLLDSAARQLLLYRGLGLTPEPRYFHLPLVVGADGRRLAKRHGDTRVVRCRASGVRAERMIGLMASWCGLARAEMDAEGFAGALEVDKIPHKPIVFTGEDEAWLMSNES